MKDSKEQVRLPRVLGLSECVTMTAGAVIGVGLFTVGASAVGEMGSAVILATFIALILVIWPALLYGEMGAALPFAGGTYAYARRGLCYPVAVFSSWHYTVAQIGVGGAEALAFSNYFGWLLKGLGISWEYDSRILASLLMLVFVFINVRGIKIAGKWQNFFMFFFWGGALIWFAMVLKDIDFAMYAPALAGLPPEITAFAKIVMMIWWCYAGFETAVGVGSEVKFPQITLPRSLILSPFLVFGVNALFQWFLLGITPLDGRAAVSGAEAPFAEAMQMAGIVGLPFIVLCLTITFGGDFSTMNPCVTTPARYMYVMAQDGCFPAIFGRVHPKYKSPYIAVLTVGAVAILLILTDSIAIIAAMCSFSEMVCYIIGFFSYLGLRRKEPDLPRAFHAPWGVLGAWVSILSYAVIMVLAVDVDALPYNIVLSVLCLLYYFLAVRRRAQETAGTGQIDFSSSDMTPTAEEKKQLDKEFHRWAWAAAAVSAAAVLLYAGSALAG